MSALTLDHDFILSEPSLRMAPMHHPWRILRDQLPDWDVYFCPLPAGKIGFSDPKTRSIFLAPDMLQVQRRTVLDHELIHAERGDTCGQPPKVEAHINARSARRTIPLHRLLDAYVWAHDIEELAEECFVDVDTMQRRLDTLDEGERAALRNATRMRDFHEEGWE